jgi:hypothetical protein
MMTARPRFLSAPATISDADAEPRLTSTASDDWVSPPRRALCTSRLRVETVVTTAPRSTNRIDQRHRLVEQAARVAAQIEDPGGGALGRQALERLGGLVRRGALELLHLHVADVLVEQLGLDRGDHDLGADQVEAQQPRLALAVDVQGHRRVGRAAHAVDRLVAGEVLGGVGPDLDDVVTGLDAGAERRRVLDRLGHRELALDHADLEPEPAELAAGRHVHLARRLGVHEVRVRIERGQHAVDGAYSTAPGRRRSSCCPARTGTRA